MAVTLRHSFESGQTSGTTITTGNSATGGNAFDSITSGTGTTATYDSTAYRASLSGAFSSSGTSAASSVNWTTSIGTAVAHCYGRTVINGSSWTVLVDFARCRGAAVQTFRLRINTSGKLEFRNSANALLSTSTTTFSTGQWYLIRWDVPVGASVTGVVYIHTDPTSAAAAETLTANAANMGTNNVDEVNYGAPVAVLANVATFRHDDVVFTDQGLPGPPIQSIAISETISFAEAVARGFIAPRSIAETLTTSDAVGRGVIASRSVSESLTASDAAARTLLLPRSITEGLTVADSPARVAQFARVGAESVSFADTGTGNAFVPARGGHFNTDVSVASATPAVAVPPLASTVPAGHLTSTQA